MAVLVEAISVVVRMDRISALYPDGWRGFVATCPNMTLCADSALARVGFMTPSDAEAFVHHLEGCGLVFQCDGQAVDIVVVDPIVGATVRCDWIEVGTVVLDGDRVSAARSLEHPDDVLYTPKRWSYAESLSETPGFVPTDEAEKSLDFLREEDGMEVYLSRLTGKEVYVGRARVGQPSTELPPAVRKRDRFGDE